MFPFVVLAWSHPCGRKPISIHSLNCRSINNVDINGSRPLIPNSENTNGRDSVACPGYRSRSKATGSAATALEIILDVPPHSKIFNDRECPQQSSDSRRSQRFTPSGSADNAPAASRRELHHATVATIAVQDRHIRVNKASDSLQRQLDPQQSQGRNVAGIASTRYRSNPYPT